MSDVVDPRVIRVRDNLYVHSWLCPGVNMDMLLLRSLDDMTLANAGRVAFDGAGIELSAEALETARRGRLRFQHYLDHVGGYVYGSTTAPGSRAKVLLSEEALKRQSLSIRHFFAIRSGVGGRMLPARCVRLAVLARLTNVLTGFGKITPGMAQAIAALAQNPPPVPLDAATCSGEVIPLSWLAAPLADLPLQVGESMAFANGSPFATALVCDVALTLERRLRMAEVLFALSVEAAQCPAGHFDTRLGAHWPDPFYQQALRRLGRLLEGSGRTELSHQAPTSWRVLPNVLAIALQALAECRTAAGIALRALKDNPTFVFDRAVVETDAVLSSAGYHDHRSARAIDAVNAAMLDVGTLASRQVGRLLDGEGVDLPPLLAKPGDIAGIEYVAWSLTGPLAAARRAAEPTGLDMGQHDPAGNQSDITSLAFVAYGKHLEAARAWDDCLASLAVIALLALDFRTAPLPSALRQFCEPLRAIAQGGTDRIAATGEPLRQIREMLRSFAEDLSTTQFEALFADLET